LRLGLLLSALFTGAGLRAGLLGLLFFLFPLVFIPAIMGESDTGEQERGSGEYEQFFHDRRFSYP
jgi:hypothetical protein